MIPGVSQEGWHVAGTITAAQSAPTTDKSWSTVNGYGSTKVAMLRSADGAVAQNVRFRGAMTNNHTNVVNVYAMRGESDHFTLIATLTLTTGQQQYAAGNLFVDTIVMSAGTEHWPDSIDIVSEASDGIAHIFFNTHGFKYFAFIATTLNSTSIIVENARE